MKKNNTFWGLIFIAAAMLLLLNQFDIFYGISLTRIAIGIVLIVISIRGLIHRNYYVFLFFIAFFCLLYDDVLHINALAPGPVLGAALLGSIGLSMLKGPDYNKNINSPHFEKVINEADENDVKFRTQFGSAIKYINSTSLSNADITCSFGCSKVYFDAAKLQNGFAEVHVDAAFGCIELFIPANWEIQQSIDAVLGAVDIKGTPDTAFTATIKLSGNVSFGGVIIHLV